MSPPRRPVGPPIGFGHRGARAECRDNTLASFGRALELGASGLESDVWITADGVAVLDHDGVVSRARHRRRISEMDRELLPAHIPSLDELYATFGSDFELSLDIKDPAAAGAALSCADRAGAAPRLWMCGTGPVLAGWRALSSVVHLVDSTAPPPEGLPARLELLVAGGVDAVNQPWSAWRAADVAAVHARGLLAFAWNAQRRKVLEALVALGIDAVYSDHVATMVEVLKR